MVNLNISSTVPINPTGATPALTRAQVWAGLQRKIRFAHEFIPVIESCEVLKDDSGVVERVVKFKKGMGPKDEAREVVKGWYDSWVDFELDDGTHIRNVISDGPAGHASDLYLTYMFEHRLPHIEDGAAAEKEKARLKEMAIVSVQSSVDVIRAMVKDGRISS